MDNIIKKSVIIITFLLVLVIPFFSHAYVPLVQVDGLTTNLDSNNPNLISEYLLGLYKFGVGLAAAIAIVLIIIGGFQYATTDAIGGKEDGKERIRNAIGGLLLALFSFLILNTIDPRLTSVDFNVGEVEVETSSVLSIAIGLRSDADMQYAGDGGELPSPNMDFDVVNHLDLSSSGTAGNYRSTWYNKNEKGADKWTIKGQTSTGIPLRFADANTVGVAAVDPNIIPYGSVILVGSGANRRVYVAGDTGSAVVNRTASGRTVPVIDFYSQGQVGREYDNFSVIPYTGGNFQSLSGENKAAVIENIRSTYLSH